jgi:hypothetical protein
LILYNNWPERSTDLCLGTEIDWLFLGYNYNKPKSKVSIRYILNKYNIHATKAFSTVITNILCESGLTPAILIKGLGINLYTSINYFNSMAVNNIYYFTKPEEKYIQDKNGYIVYILKCNDGSYYTGYTANIIKRVQQHQNGTGCTFTKSGLLLSLYSLKNIRTNYLLLNEKSKSRN